MLQNGRVFNFSAGPSMLPLPVIEEVAANLANYKGTGESVMEMSHRSGEFQQIMDDAEANLRKLMNIPDNYKVLFLQGGGTLQFSMVPLNLLRKSGKADLCRSSLLIVEGLRFKVPTIFPLSTGRGWIHHCTPASRP